MSGPTGPPPDHRVGRQARLLRFLRVATVLTAVLTVIAVAVPGSIGRATGVGVVAVLVITPLVRVAWLGLRWLRRGDRRYAAVAGGLLLIVGAAALVG